MFKKTYLLLLIYIMFSVLSLNAYILTPKDLVKYDIFVQVGALKKVESIQDLIEKLDAFALYIEHDKQLSRVFVVLQKKGKNRRVLIRKIRKIIPDAFVKKSFTSHILTMPSRHKNSISENLYNKSLDAEAILKTRKKFF